MLFEVSGVTTDVTNTGGNGSINGHSGQARHSDGSSFLLCDGHVKWLHPIQVSSGWDSNNSNVTQDNTSSNAGVNGSIAEGTGGSQFVVTMSSI